ncbi:MAG: hypothetical protein NTV97_34375 [Alphaproteobacteria bacterium]|nr:hypothetical protein [Alphaproteobacteria bacterium]
MMSRLMVIALIGLLSALPAVAQTDAALAAIMAHPEVKRQMAAITKVPLIWRKLDDTPGLDCYQLKENHPTHLAQVDTYCRARADGKILKYDVAKDTYDELRASSAGPRVPVFDMMGPGTLSCGDFLKDIASSQANEAAFYFWTQGFMSGANAELRIAGKQVRNLNTSQSSGDGLTAFLRSYCTDRRTDPVLLAVVALLRTLPQVQD